MKCSLANCFCWRALCYKTSRTFWHWQARTEETNTSNFWPTSERDSRSKSGAGCGLLPSLSPSWRKPSTSAGSVTRWDKASFAQRCFFNVAFWSPRSLIHFRLTEVRPHSESRPTHALLQQSVRMIGVASGGQGGYTPQNLRRYPKQIVFARLKLATLRVRIGFYECANVSTAALKFQKSVVVLHHFLAGALSEVLIGL